MKGKNGREKISRKNWKIYKSAKKTDYDSEQDFIIDRNNLRTSSKMQPFHSKIEIFCNYMKLKSVIGSWENMFYSFILTTFLV